MENQPENLAGPVAEALDQISDVQVAIFGVYGLVAPRYEVFCGRQGAAGVADPDLLKSHIDPLASYSSAGRQAFRQKQRQAVISAAHRAGRKADDGGGGSAKLKPGAAAGSRTAKAGGGGAQRGVGRGAAKMPDQVT